MLLHSNLETPLRKATKGQRYEIENHISLPFPTQKIAISELMSLFPVWRINCQGKAFY